MTHAEAGRLGGLARKKRALKYRFGSGDITKFKASKPTKRRSESQKRTDHYRFGSGDITKFKGSNGR